jgi:hypothetical protein
MAQSNASNSRVGFDEQFDSRLMNPSESSSDKAGALNEAKRQSGNQAGSSEEPQTLREAVIAAKREESKKEQGGVKGGLKAKAKAPTRKALSKLLAESWINLPASFGLTLIWINIHVFLRIVIGKSLFCKLGEEWLESGIMPGSNSARESIMGKSLSDKVDKVNGCANIGESMMLLALDLVLLLIIFIILVIIGALLQIITNPMAFISQAFGWVWSSLGITKWGS